MSPDGDKSRMDHVNKSRKRASVDSRVPIKPDVLYRRGELADQLNCSARTIDRHASRGDLRALAVGCQVRFLGQDVITWIENCTAEYASV